MPAINSEKTTMILLCDDGSLKIYVADSEKTEYWLKPHLQPTSPIMQLKAAQVWSSTSLFQLSPSSILNKKTKSEAITTAPPATLCPPAAANTAAVNKPQDPEPAATQTQSQTSSGSSLKLPNKNSSQLKRQNATRSKPKSVEPKAVTFPVDYFEKCTLIADIEYGGNDLLEIYNTQQLKARLGLGGNKFVVSMKSPGVKLEITNTADSQRTLLMGCRILVGTHSIERAPSYFEVFDRRVPVKLTRSRWFDVCLTRDEALIADNKLSVFISSSADARHITVIDACVCYGKSKEQLNWNKAEVQLLQKRYNQTKMAAGQANGAAKQAGGKTAGGKQLLSSSDVSSEHKLKMEKKAGLSDKQDANSFL